MDIQKPQSQKQEPAGQTYQPHVIPPEEDLADNSSLNQAPEPRDAKPPKAAWRKHLLSSFLALLLLAAVAVAGSYGWYKYQLKPASNQELAKEFVIAPGTGAVAIGDKLEADGLIRSSTAFQFYLRRTDKTNKIQAGTYLLTPSVSSQKIAGILAEGKTASRLVTIIPGLRIDQVAKTLVEKGYPKEEVDKALKTPNPYKEGASLEGYIHPETYTLDLTDSAQDVIDVALAAFDKQLTPEIKSGIESQGLSVHGATILASIVQKESSQPETQKKIAQVFLKRLKEDVALGADPTFRYAAYLTGGIESPTIDHPYNTRLNKGLTPGPIGNFNFSALDAVANPAEGDFLFFVSGDDGKTYFSNTQAEHQALIDEHCIKLCKL
ncbi:endolytic transglycosylase MltG [Candidatus Saccharibacteria bacterium]|nr:endolytic transglycosylase MltG [Candidatus Saccharibacteria bacterium]